MNLIFLGAPGVGKGTQARMLSQKLDIPHISTGEIFRENMKNETELGKKILSYMDAGQLVPDNIVIEVITDRLKCDDCSNGYILDGVPRTIPQAEYLDTLVKIDKVINFSLSEEEIIARLSERRTCKDCGFAHHCKYLPPKARGICDKCGGELIQRSDETPEAVTKRLEEYNALTFPLIEYFTKQEKLIDIDAAPAIEVIHKDVVQRLIKRG